MEKEDLNPNYGTDLDEASSVAQVARVIAFIRLFNMIHDVTKNWQQARDTNLEYENVDGSQENCHFSKPNVFESP